MAIQIKKTTDTAQAAEAPATAQEEPSVQSIAEPTPTPPPETKEAPKAGKKVGGTELAAILAQIRKEKGDNVVNTGREIPIVERIPTGVFEFDLATGGGFPRSRYSIVYGPESSGKCHAKGDHILMYDGTIKAVEDIKVGDLLMGPDSAPREVLKIGGGYGPLFKITPVKGGGGFTVNGDHQLHLVCTHDQGNRYKGQRVQISVNEYLSKSNDWKIYHHLYRVGVDFTVKPLPVDPYFLGLWLGDGSSTNMQVYSVSEEIVDWLQSHADYLGGRLSVYDTESACPGYAIVGTPYRAEMQEMGLFGNKHIPSKYLTSSRSQRLELLAGLIDTDGSKGSGSSCVFYNSNQQLCNQVQWLARSLGYYASVSKKKKTTCNGQEFDSWQVYISMDSPAELPLRLEYKRPPKRTGQGSCLTSRFTVEPVGDGEFFGFEVDEDHLYMTDEFIVNHNTNICYAAAAQAQKLPEPCNKVVWVDLEGCVAEDSRFIDMVSGQVYTAREVYEQRLPLVVRSYDNDQGKIIFKPLADWIDNGVKEVFSVETATSELRVTGNHKLWVRESLDAPAKWVRTDELQVGWYVSRPHKDKDWQWPEKGEHTGDEAHFLGLMLGDGSFNSSGSPTFCNIDPATIDRLRGLLTPWGMKLTTYSDRHHRLTGEVKASKWAPTHAAKLIRAWGLHGCTGQSKHVPEQFFSETRSVTLELLAGLYMTDGTVNKVRPTLALSNTSLTLLEQVRELWRRLGVYSTLHKTKMYADHHTQQYILSINGLEQLQSVAGMLPLYGDKMTRLLQWADTPVSESCQSRTGKVGVSKFKGGLVWDRLTSVEPFGEQQTYDFTVFETHNYVVNDLVAHNTFDAKWASQFGIDVDELLVVRPSYGEEAVDLIDALVRAEDVAMLVVDSLATVVSSKEIDQSVEKFDVGTASLLVKRLCNKLVIALATESKRGHTPAVVLINQTRFKIGVMFGDPECVTADTLVNFVDGRSIPMEEVVSKKLVGPVWAFNEATNAFEPRKILSHHINGSAKDGELITLRTGGYDTLNGTMGATVSFTHKFLTASGWKRAGELTKADLLVSRFRTRVNGTTLDFLRGASCGDLTLATRNPATGGHTTEIRIQDSENPTYADWKASKLSAFTFSRIVTASGKVRHVSNASYSLTVFKGEVSGRSPIPLLSNFTWLGFSVWVMDDAHFQESHGRYFLAMGRYRTNPEMRAEISARLNLLGLDHKWKQDKQVVFTVSASKVIASNIAKYVPPCMQYKLPAGYRGRYEEFSLTYSEELVPIFIPIHEIGPASKRQYRNPTYYDIHVEGLNNYSVGNMDNGFVVHNTMPGGQTMKFLSSLTVRLYGKNKMEKTISSELPAFKETKAVIKKAKVGVTKYDFDYDLCMLPHDGMIVGETKSWSTVSGYLKDMGALKKADKGSGWTLLGKTYQTLVLIQDYYESDDEFKMKLQGMVIKSFEGKYFTVEATGAAGGH